MPQRWWRNLPLAAQHALITLAVVALWASVASVVVSDREKLLAVPAAEVRELEHIRNVGTEIGLELTGMDLRHRAFVATGDPRFRSAFVEAESRVVAALDSLRTLTERRPALRMATRRLDGALRRWERAFAGERMAEGTSLTPAEWRSSEALMDTARTAHGMLASAVLAEMSAAHARLDDARARARWQEVVALVALLLVLVALSLLALRLVPARLDQIIQNAKALADGRYDALRSSHELGASRELRNLATVFDRLALAIAEREQILQSEILQVKEVEQMKNDFVSTVSHELRTPLTSMRGALGLVLAGTAGEVGPRAHQLLLIASQNTERLIRLINDILDIEKIEAGGVEIRRERVDLAAVLASTAAGLEGFALENDVHLVIEGEATAFVTGDFDRLVQVFTNLLSNAVKFSPREGVVTMRLETQGSIARVAVTDRGAGVPPEFHARIFGKFQQAETSSSRKSGGTGLGLAIARAIIELHQGTIRFESAPGVGTTFVVELPYATPAPAAPPRSGADEHHILIVEDDVGMLRVLQTLCQPLGDVAAVRSAEEAWTLARTSVFDAIVLDPGLPGVDGFEFVRRLRTLAPYGSIPILVFSAREFPPEALHGIVLSPTHAFVKSRDREQDLVLRLRAVLAARRSR